VVVGFGASSADTKKGDISAHITASITDARAETASLAEELLHGTRILDRLCAMPVAAVITHVLFWLIGAMAVVGGIGAFAAMFTMGRSGYRKD
jgi:hypothetical protein